jgi:hypothetical protein
MSPRSFLYLSDPKLDPDNIRGMDQKNIDDLAEKMKKGEPIDTPYLQIHLDGMDVYSHEGRHRALGAIKAGIKQMPVYIYTDDPMTDDQRKQLSVIPSQVLTPYYRN